MIKVVHTPGGSTQSWRQGQSNQNSGRTSTGLGKNVGAIKQYYNDDDSVSSPNDSKMAGTRSRAQLRRKGEALCTNCYHNRVQLRF